MAEESRTPPPGAAHPGADDGRGEKADLILDLLAHLEIGCLLFRQAVTARLDLSLSEHLVLDLLIRHGGLSGSQLSGMTGLTSGAISSLARRLEADGFLSRLPDPWDARSQTLDATPAAVEHIAATLDRLDVWDRRELTAHLLEGFGDAELGAVTVFLSRATNRAFREARSLRTWRRGPSRWRSRGSRSRPAPNRSAPE